MSERRIDEIRSWVQTLCVSTDGTAVRPQPGEGVILGRIRIFVPDRTDVSPGYHYHPYHKQLFLHSLS